MENKNNALFYTNLWNHNRTCKPILVGSYYNMGGIPWEDTPNLS